MLAGVNSFRHTGSDDYLYLDLSTNQRLANASNLIIA